jgi:hypothetical protein
MSQLLGLPESSGGRIRSFTCRYHYTMVLHAHVLPEGWAIGPLVAVQRRSLTPSTWSWSSSSSSRTHSYIKHFEKSMSETCWYYSYSFWKRVKLFNILDTYLPLCTVVFQWPTDTKSIMHKMETCILYMTVCVLNCKEESNELAKRMQKFTAWSCMK